MREVGAPAVQQDGGVSVRYRLGADTAIAGARKFQLQHEAGAASGAAAVLSAAIAAAIATTLTATGRS